MNTKKVKQDMKSGCFSYTFEGPLYHFWKQFQAKRIGHFTRHEKFEKQLHIHRKKASNHVPRKNKNYIYVSEKHTNTIITKIYLNILPYTLFLHGYFLFFLDFVLVYQHV